ENPWRDSLAQFNKILIASSMVILMITMGLDLNWKKVLESLRKPVGCLIAIFCQFIMLPALTFTLIMIFPIDPYSALGILILSCCPGGGNSNFITYKINGDLALSIVMTSVSILLALVMMPLNIWLYSRHLLTADFESLVVPYKSILISLVT
ncbi:unnamed protein product, partial [Meganyctiphanes norvegica]